MILLVGMLLYKTLLIKQKLDNWVMQHEHRPELESLYIFFFHKDGT